MIGFLITLLSILLSPIGMLAVLSGFLFFIISPFIPKATNEYHIFARFYQWLGASMLGRAAIVLSEQGDLLLKEMWPDDIGTEKMKFNETTKEFEDPAHRKSYWAGIPFALADEVHGILFDPRDPALGDRKRKAEEQSEMVIKATASERETYSVQGWVKGVLAFPKKTYELVDLTQVRQLVSGSERAEHPERVKEFYENSRDPYDDGTGTSRFIMIIVALIGPFAAMWLIASQGGSGGGSSVSFGMLMLLFSMQALSDVIGGVEWRRWGIRIGIALPAVIIFGLVAVIAGATIAGILGVLFLLGFFTIPIIIFLLRPSAKATDKLAERLIKFGLFAYEKPVFEWTPRGYKTREYSHMDNVDEANVSWHTFLGKMTGFTFTPGPDSWDTEVADKDEIENKTVTDGGELVAQTNIPSGYRRMPDDGRAVYGDVVPSQLKGTNYYIHTGIAL
jgi:hypothetical protein